MPLDFLPDDIDAERLVNKPSYFAEKILNLELFPYQKDFVDADSRKRVFRAGRQVGKSRCVAVLALHKALTKPNADIIITAEAQRQARELINQIKTEISKSPLDHDQWGVDRGVQMTIEFDTGSRIIAIPTGQSGEKIRTYTADMLIVDEAAFINDDIFYDALEPMTLTTDGDIILTSTPLGKHGFFYEKDQHPNWHRTHVASSASPLISDEKFEDMKDGRTKRQINQELLGNFVSSDETFFPTELLKQNSAPNIDATSSTQYLAVDPAGTGADRSAFVAIDGDGNVFKHETFNPETDPLTKTSNFAQTWHEMYNFDKIIVDQTGMGQGPVEMIRDRVGRNRVEGIKLKTLNKQNIYQGLKVELEDGNITIPSDEDFIRELDNIVYSTTQNGMYKFHADSGRDDRADSLALAVSQIDGTSSGSKRGNRFSGISSLGELGQRERNRSGSSQYRF